MLTPVDEVVRLEDTAWTPAEQRHLYPAAAERRTCKKPCLESASRRAIRNLRLHGSTHKIPYPSWPRCLHPNLLGPTHLYLHLFVEHRPDSTIGSLLHLLHLDLQLQH